MRTESEYVFSLRPMRYPIVNEKPFGERKKAVQVLFHDHLYSPLSFFSCRHTRTPVFIHKSYN